MGKNTRRELLWAVGGGRWEMFTVEQLSFFWESWNVSNDSFAILYPFFCSGRVEFIYSICAYNRIRHIWISMSIYTSEHVGISDVISVYFHGNAMKTSSFTCFHPRCFLKVPGPKKIFELSDRVTLFFSFTISERRIQRLQEKIPLVHKPGGLLGLVDGIFRGVSWWRPKKNPGGTLIFLI